MLRYKSSIQINTFNVSIKWMVHISQQMGANVPTSADTCLLLGVNWRPGKSAFRACSPTHRSLLPHPHPQQQAELIRAGVLLKGLFVRKEEIELFGLGLGKQELSLCERTNRSRDEQNARGTKTTGSKQNLFFFLMCRLKECLGTGLSDWFLMSHLYGFP